LKIRQSQWGSRIPGDLIKEISLEEFNNQKVILRVLVRSLVEAGVETGGAAGEKTVLSK
jgi:hypothetical protein